MSDPFFTQDHCDRCGSKKMQARTMSWFTNETICMECKRKETELNKELREQGENPAKYEGCGYIPKTGEVK